MRKKELNELIGAFGFTVLFISIGAGILLGKFVEMDTEISLLFICIGFLFFIYLQEKIRNIKK